MAFVFLRFLPHFLPHRRFYPVHANLNRALTVAYESHHAWSDRADRGVLGCTQCRTAIFVGPLKRDVHATDALCALLGMEYPATYLILEDGGQLLIERVRPFQCIEECFGVRIVNRFDVCLARWAG